MGIEGFKEQQEWQFRTQKQSQPEYKPAQATESLSDIAERDAADAQLEAAFNEEKSKTMKEEDNKENLIDAKVDKIIKDCKKAIEKSAEEFGVDKYIIAAIIYNEQLSLSPGEDIIDGVSSFFKESTSVGLGQVQLKTARFLEEQGLVEKIPKKENSLTSFHSYAINMRWDDYQMRILRLQDPVWNIKYVAAYLHYLQNLRKGKFPTITSRPDILATCYNIGRDKEEHVHSNPQPNDYGRDVEKIYPRMKQLMG